MESSSNHAALWLAEITQVTTTQHVTTPVTVQTMQTSSMQQAQPQPQQQVYHKLQRQSINSMSRQSTIPTVVFFYRQYSRLQSSRSSWTRTARRSISRRTVPARQRTAARTRTVLRVWVWALCTARWASGVPCRPLAVTSRARRRGDSTRSRDGWATSTRSRSAGTTSRTASTCCTVWYRSWARTRTRSSARPRCCRKARTTSGSWEPRGISWRRRWIAWDIRSSALIRLLGTFVVCVCVCVGETHHRMVKLINCIVRGAMNGLRVNRCPDWLDVLGLHDMILL